MQNATSSQTRVGRVRVTDQNPKDQEPLDARQEHFVILPTYDTYSQCHTYRIRGVMYEAIVDRDEVSSRMFSFSNAKSCECIFDVYVTVYDWIL